MALGRAAVTSSHDMPVVESHPRIDTGTEGDITPIATKPFELPREATPVPLGDPAGQPDVLPRAVELASGGGRPGEIEQDLDSLLGDTHQPNGDAAVG